MTESQENDCVVRGTAPPRRGERQRGKSSKYCDTQFYTSPVRKKQKIARKETARVQGESSHSQVETRQNERVLSAPEEDDPYSMDNRAERVQQASGQIHFSTALMIVWTLLRTQ